MSEVVRLRGEGPVNHPGKPDTVLIEGLEWLLDRARSGEIVGLAYATTYFDGSGTDHFIGTVGTTTIGGLFRVATRLSGQLDAE